MLDLADVVAINKFERRGAEDALRDVGRQMVRNREAFGKSPTTCRSSARAPRRSTTTASPPSTRSCAACWPTRGCRVEEGALAAVAAAVDPLAPSCRRAGALPGRDQPRRSAATTQRRRRYAAQARGCSGSRPCVTSSRRGGRRPGASTAARGCPHGAAPASPSTGLDDVAGRRRVVLRRRAGRADPRQGDPHAADAGVPVGQQDPRVALPRSRSRRARLVPAPREPARLLPVHGGRLPVQARQRGPGAHVRRRRRPVPHQPPLQAALRGPAGDAAVHGVRLRDALRPRPRPAARHLRQGRHLRRLRRDARRHEGPL